MTDHAIELYDLQQALEHFEKGRLDEVMDILQRAIASNTSNPLFYELRGLVYELQSKYDKAIADFNHVIALGSNESDSYLHRGRVWSKLREYERAVGDFDAAVALNPNAETHLARGEAYMELGEYYTALDDYDRSVTLGPQAYAYVGRGTVHYRLNEYDTAMDDFNKATLLDRSNTQAFVMRGTIYQEKRNYRRAIDEYTQVIEVIADSVGADISDLEFLSSDIKHELYELAVLDLGNAFCGRGVCGSRTKDYDGALADLDAAIRLTPSNANFYCARGIAYIEMGQHEKAMEELDVAIELDPNSTNPLFVKANFHLGKGEFKEAIADVHRAIELNPRWSDLHWIGGTARFLLGEYEEAIEDFSRAIDVASEHHSEPSLQSGGVPLTLGPPIVGSAYVSRAVSYSLLGNDSNARDDFNRALELERSQTEIEEDIAELISDEKIRETVVDLVRSVKIDGRAGITQQSKYQVSKGPSLRRPAHSEKLVQRPVVRGHRTLAKEEYTDLFRRLGFYDIETGKTLKHQKPIPSIYFNCRYGAVSFVAYRKDKHRYRPKLWDQLPPQKKKDAKHNLMTIVPKVGKEQEAFEEILV